MANMITLIPIEPRNDAHGALIVTAFYSLFINGGGQSDGCGFGAGGFGDGDGNGGFGAGGGSGSGGYGKCPEEWRVE